MNRGIPKSARDALAGQGAGAEHPSADLLNGYVEQSLSAAEKAGVMQHLAACEDCREVVFLASGAAEEPSAATVAEPARAWRGWKWAVPAVAVLALVASILVERRERLAAPQLVATQTANQEADTIPSQSVASQPTPKSNAPASKPASSPALEARLKPPEPTRATVTKGKETSAHNQVAGATAAAAMISSADKQQALAELVNPATPAVPPSPAAVPRNAEATSTAPAVSAGELQTAVSQTAPTAHALGALGGSSFKSLNKAATPLGLTGTSHGALTIRSRWRIAAEGHLERSQTADTWTRVLADQSVRFRSVAVVGNDVWAGGNNGALFHSVDGGEHWTPVVLSADGHPETGAVVSIQFDTISRGSVITESGTTWTTSDGGQSWSKQ